MPNHPRVQKIDPHDRRVQAALEAEQRLFDHYGVDYRAHSVELGRYGVRLRVLEMGSGPPLVLVPGGNGDAIELVPMIAKLEGRRVIAINRPGAGMSDALDHKGVEFRQLALNCLTTVLDHFEIEEADFAVNSLGGLWAFWLTLDQPERVSSIVQFGCPAFVLGTSAPLPMRLLSVPYLNRLLFRAFRARSTDDIRKVFGMLGCTEETRAHLPEPYVDAFLKMFSLPTYQFNWLRLMESLLTVRGSRSENVLGPAQLSRISPPTMFVWGDGDEFGGVDVGREIASLMPDAEMRVIAGSHVPYIDNPGECARLTNEFMSQRETPSLPVAAAPHTAS